MNVIFRNTRTDQALVMPVMPPEFQVEAGRRVESLEMAQTGEVNLPGLSSLFNEQQEFLLPAEARSYTGDGYTGDPYALVDTLVEWSLRGDVLRYLVTETTVNFPVLLGPVRYRESGGAGDVTVTLALRQYRDLTAETTERNGTGNAGRSTVTAKKAAGSHTVVKGNTLWGIARKYYGDGSLAYKLARYNSVKNPNLIFPGQTLTIPDRGLL